MTEIIVKIRDDGYVAVEEERNGIKSFKPITADSLIACVNRSLVRSGVTSGLLPKGCIAFTSYDDGSKRVCMVHQELYADVSYFGTMYNHFPLPRLVFGFTINNEGRITGCDMGVIENKETLKPKTVMFHYPFSNVSGFRLCTGNNIMPRCESLHTLGSVPYLILNMPNNNDYFRPDNNKRNLEMRDLLELLKDKPPEFYYTDVLIPNEKKLEDFIK